jgi:hypothetical protein
MGKYEMWGHLHPSLHKLQTKTIATYCYQQRLFRTWDLLIESSHIQWKLMDDYVQKLMTTMWSSNLVIFAEISYSKSWREKYFGLSQIQILSFTKLRKFEMSMIGEWNFIFGPQIKQIEGR